MIDSLERGRVDARSRYVAEMKGGEYRLTRQETRLLTLLVAGHHKKTAADAMGVSVNTVSFHLKNIYIKLQVHSKTEAVVKVLLAGVVVPEYAPPTDRRWADQEVVSEIG